MASNGIVKQPRYITKKAEYSMLLELIKRNKVAVARGRGYNIQAIATSLNLDPKTVRIWLQSPRVQRAIADQVEFYINKMQETGKDDWRQWQAQVELARKINENDNKKISANQFNVLIIKNSEKVAILEKYS